MFSPATQAAQDRAWRLAPQRPPTRPGTNAGLRPSPPSQASCPAGTPGAVLSRQPASSPEYMVKRHQPPASSSSRLNRVDLAQPPGVTLFAAEVRREESPDESNCEFRANDTRAQAEHIHIVVLYPLMSRVVIVADRGADALHLIGGHARAHTAAADQHAALGASVQDGLAHRFGKVGIVVGGVELERAHIHRLMAFFANLLQNKRFQR